MLKQSDVTVDQLDIFQTKFYEFDNSDKFDNLMILIIFLSLFCYLSQSSNC